jgi:hypothetical protein
MLRRLGPVLAMLALVCGLTGCMISTQEGEKTHVNAPDPDRIVFHFDTSFNRALLYGRSMALLGVAVWFFRARRGGGSSAVTIALAALLAAGAVGLYVVGSRKLSGYRIDLAPTGMELNLPPRPALHVDWREIRSIDGEGESANVSFDESNPTWSTQWERLTIRLADGGKIDVDLEPLSVEQRGTLWRAVARFAELEVKTWVQQTPP